MSLVGDVFLQPGKDPALIDQFAALEPTELQMRWNELTMIRAWKFQPGGDDTLSEMPADHLQDAPEDHRQLAMRLASLVSYQNGAYFHEVSSHELIYLRRVSDFKLPASNHIPEILRESLLHQLRMLTWPKRRHRKKVQSERYAVVWRNPGPRPEFSTLFPLLEELMRWANPEAPWTHIAVTKNFTGSPHRDDQDTTWQYICSLGDFDSDNGGQLCIEDAQIEELEGEGPLKRARPFLDDESVRDMEIDEFRTASLLAARRDHQQTTSGKYKSVGHRILYTVTTHNRMARVDGRYMHFVRGFHGERFSLVFYCLDPSGNHYTEKTSPIDFNWKPSSLSTTTLFEKPMAENRAPP